MRGSIYYQTALLTKMIFKEGSLKVERIDPNHEYYMCVSSFSTMEAYRQIWNNFGKHLRAVWEIKNFEEVRFEHIEDYIEMKILDGCSKQYIEKISSALSKLEIALTKFCADKSKKKYSNQGIALLKKNSNITSNYHNRAYDVPEKIIENLDNDIFKLAATIQLESGARFKGVRKIKMSQLKEKKVDEITGSLCGMIETKEKGGRVGDVFVSIDTYDALKTALLREKEFKIDYAKYAKNIRDTCEFLNIECHGSHGFRWNFAKRRLVEYQNIGHGYNESLTKVSKEMKHNRKIITEYYLG